MTTHIKVRATVNALGLKRGDVAVVELGPTADAMVEQGHWIWLDPPDAEPEYTLTETVKARKPRAKKVDEALEAELAAEDAFLDSLSFAEAHVDYTQFPEPTDDDVWSDDGGSTPA